METLTPELVQVSRFADPSRTTTIPLGPCLCPGGVHGDDSAEIRSEIGDGEFRSAVNRGGFSGGPVFDPAKSDDEFIATFTTSWTFLDRVGQPMPITARNASLLDEGTRLAFIAGLNAAAGSSVQISKAQLLEAIDDVAAGDVVPASSMLSIVSLLMGRERVLPNGSGGPSRASSRGTASPRRRAKKH